MRTCSRCKQQFNPSSNHKCCPRCRAWFRKKPCQSCGKPTASKICLSCFNSKRVGPLSPTWKGGRHVNKDGYVVVAMGGYNALEHRVVMEKAIGRPLLESENVHHKNGVRHDNSPSNLELWVSTQPSGQRIEDLLKWAEEIIFKYRGFSDNGSTVDLQSSRDGS